MRCVKCRASINPGHAVWFLPPPPGTSWAGGQSPYVKCQSCGPFGPSEIQFMHQKLRAAQKAAFAAADPVIASRGCGYCNGRR